MLGKYLVHSYLYYILDDPVITDDEYDTLCKELLDKFDTLQHPHKHLTTKESLLAGPGYHIPSSAYPTIVKSIAWTIKDKTWKTQKPLTLRQVDDLLTALLLPAVETNTTDQN